MLHILTINTSILYLPNTPSIKATISAINCIIAATKKKNIGSIYQSLSLEVSRFLKTLEPVYSTHLSDYIQLIHKELHQSSSAADIQSYNRLLTYLNHKVVLQRNGRAQRK